MATIFRQPIYAEINENSIITNHQKISKRTPVVLVANTQKAAFRITTGPIKKLSKWELIESNFPIGLKMNESTHIFDGTIYNSPSSSCFLMVALPIQVANNLSNIATSQFSIHSIKRLDTIENIIFNHFAPLAKEPLWLFFPQEDGMRILHMANFLPLNAHTISNNPNQCNYEATIILESAKKSPETFPQKAVFIESDSADNWGWLFNILKPMKITVEIEPYNLQKMTHRKSGQNPLIQAKQLLAIIKKRLRRKFHTSNSQ